MSENAATGWDTTQSHHGSPHNIVYTKTLALHSLLLSKPQECSPASLLRYIRQQQNNWRSSPAALLSLMGENGTQNQHSGSRWASRFWEAGATWPDCYSRPQGVDWGLMVCVGGCVWDLLENVEHDWCTQGYKRECRESIQRWEALESWGCSSRSLVWSKVGQTVFWRAIGGNVKYINTYIQI